MEQFNIDNFGFVILCSERNLAGVKATVRSIKSFFPDKPYLCVVGNNVLPNELKEFNKACRTIEAGSTYASLLNVGIVENQAEWSMIFIAGRVARPGLLAKYKTFCENNKQVLFPVIDKKWIFYEASIHGLFLHRKTINEVGVFSNQEEDFSLVKLLWATNAIEEGYQFKALVGVTR